MEHSKTRTADWYALEAKSFLSCAAHPERTMAALLASHVAAGRVKQDEGLALAAAIAAAAALCDHSPAATRSSPWIVMLVGLQVRLEAESDTTGD